MAPPNDLAAEEAVLGACLFSHAAIDLVRPILRADSFYRPAHAEIWRSLLELRDEDAPTDPIALGSRLQQHGALERVGGRSRLHTLAASAAPAANADYYAEIVANRAQLRRLQVTAARTLQMCASEAAEPAQVRQFLAQAVEADASCAPTAVRLQRHAVDGWSFINAPGLDVAPIWGCAEQAGWSAGESLMLVGPPGVGKSTLAHQLVMARLGLMDSVLGMPVAEGKRVLYLAMDRPTQIAKALRRLARPEHREILEDRLKAWAGPLPATLDAEPDLLAELAAAHDSDTVVIDSVKDIVAKLTDDEAVGAYNRARQQLLRSGVELLELHHQRKSPATDARSGGRPSLDKVYGTTWFTAGAGSVIFLTGPAGQAQVQLHQVKTLTGEIGPLTVIHDHVRGISRVDDADRDPFDLLRAAGGGLTARELAELQTGAPEPSPKAREKARRALAALYEQGRATKADEAGGQVRYQAIHRRMSVVASPA